MGDGGGLVRCWIGMGFVFSPGRERNPALTKSGCQPREAEGLRVSGGGAGATLGVAFGASDVALQTESAATWRVARNVAWLADLRQAPSAAISRRAANKKAAEVLGGLKNSPTATLFVNILRTAHTVRARQSRAVLLTRHPHMP